MILIISSIKILFQTYSSSSAFTSNNQHSITTTSTNNDNLNLDLGNILKAEELKENQQENENIFFSKDKKEPEEDKPTATFNASSRPTVSGVLQLRTNKEHIKFFHKGCKPPYKDFSINASELTIFIQSFNHKAHYGIRSFGHPKGW